MGYLTLTNVGTGSCYLDGYPGISLYDAIDKLLPLDYHWGGDQEVTDTAPERVGLAPGGVAYVLINKYRCDLGDLAVAQTVELIPPDDTAPLTLNLGGMGGEDYCVPGESAGMTLSISPVEATAQGTLHIPTDGG